MNLIVICVDSWRADILGGRGHCRWIQAPALADLARQSVVFEHAFGEGMPTVQMRRNFFTGMRSYPWHHNVDSLGLAPSHLGWHRIPGCHTTLAELLLQRGYCTGLISDTYHLFKPAQNFTRGFLSWDFIRGQQGDNWRVGPLAGLDLRRYVPDEEVNDWATHAQIINHLINTRERKSEEDHFAPQVFRSAIRWLNDAKDNAPFFLWINSLTIGVQGIGARSVNKLIGSFFFDEARGRAWIKHNIEEVGNFESFLPQLYAAEANSST